MSFEQAELEGKLLPLRLDERDNELIFWLTNYFNQATFRNENRPLVGQAVIEDSRGEYKHSSAIGNRESGNQIHLVPPPLVKALGSNR